MAASEESQSRLESRNKGREEGPKSPWKQKAGFFRGYRDFGSGPKVDFRMVQKKFWRPKLFSEATKILEVNPNAEISRVMTVELSTDAWKDSLSFLSDKALFVKWGGIWLTFSRFRNWCDKNWGEGMDLKTLGNGYYLVVCSITQDRDWIIENGPFFIKGKGLNISAWTPNFNPCEATIEKTLIWIKLLGLPQKYKDVEMLKQIGNHLGEYVMLEELVDPSDFSLISRLCIN
ncbi:hypothetical protein SUGI_0267740 [Cryptomeria japonica]|nr:hypothetical protein SUGI_0267740 [Cryptomeria japonica]